MKQAYDDECVRKERVSLDLLDSKKQIDQLNSKLTDKDKMILNMEQRMMDYELTLKDKVNQYEDLKNVQNRQGEKHRDELAARDNEIQRLSKAIRELSRECEKAGLNLEELEKVHLKDLDAKKNLEGECNDLARRVKDLSLRLEEAIGQHDRDARERRRIEEELGESKMRELETLERVRELRDENQRLKVTIEKAVEQEHEHNERFREEREFLQNKLGQRDREIEELNKRINGLEQNLFECEEKNKKLVDLLNQEIQKQAEEFKKKALTTLFAPARKLAENIAGGPSKSFDFMSAEEELEKLRYEHHQQQQQQNVLEVSEQDEEEPPNKSMTSPEKLRRVILEPDEAARDEYERYQQDIKGQEFQENLQKQREITSTYAKAPNSRGTSNYNDQAETAANTSFKQVKGLSSYERAAQEMYDFCDIL
jgi:hypothetical protein